MSMFDWQVDVKEQSSNPKEGNNVVPRHFWIYWVVSVPLTIVVLSTLGIWWHREKKHYRKRYPHVKLDDSIPYVGPNFFKRLIKMMWERRKLEDIEELN
jgi:hypothetical protein